MDQGQQICKYFDVFKCETHVKLQKIYKTIMVALKTHIVTFIVNFIDHGLFLYI